jgi:hypothetical protein
VAWKNIELRLHKALEVKVTFPRGIVWLTPTPLSLDDWLTSVAGTEEELDELNTSGIRFFRRRWPIAKLVELEWDEPVEKRAFWLMEAGPRAYILFNNGMEYQVVAGIEPIDDSTLYSAVILTLLRNAGLAFRDPSSVRNYRPDLIPYDLFETCNEDETCTLNNEDSFADKAASFHWTHPASLLANVSTKDCPIAKLLIVWVGRWIELPVLGSWYADEPDSFRTLNSGDRVLKYPDAQLFPGLQKEQPKRRPYNRIEPEDGSQTVK